MHRTENQTKPKRFVVPLVVVLLSVLAVLLGKNHSVLSDPHGTILTALSIVEYGSPKLDNYQQYLPQYSYQIQNKSEHYYYYFPIGTPLVAVPLVGIAKYIGFDVVEHEIELQLLLAIASLIITYCLLYLIAAIYLRSMVAQVIAALFLFGTSFISTGATALWSHNFAAMFALWAIYLFLIQKNTGADRGWLMLGASLFLAYLCRPTMALLVPVLIGLQFWIVDKRSAVKSASVFLVFILVFMAWSRVEYGQILPDYYLPKRLASQTFWTALIGNYVSPARGLFVFSPILLLPVLVLLVNSKPFTKYLPEIALLVWPLAHSIVISKFPHWWAGYSFGPRLMYDVLPAFYVLFVVFIKQYGNSRVSRAAIVVLASISIAIHYGQGVFNQYASIWNGNPSIDQNPEYLFDWRYPQFLHSRSQHDKRLAEFNNRAVETDVLAAIKSEKQNALEFRSSLGPVVDKDLGKVRGDIAYRFDAKELRFIGWNEAEPQFRWSSGYYSEIVFVPEIGAGVLQKVEMDFVSLLDQEVYFQINDAEKVARVVSVGDITLAVNVDGLLKSEQLNVIKIEMPRARMPGNGDPRILALALKSIRFIGAPNIGGPGVNR